MVFIQEVGSDPLCTIIIRCGAIPAWPTGKEGHAR